MTVEERLRRVLADERLALPAWTDPVGRVRAGIARRRIRRLFAVFGATLLATITTALWAGVLAPADPRPSPTPSIGSMPWKDSPVGGDALFPPPSPRPTTRPCGAVDLAAAADVLDAGAAAGRRFVEVSVRNASRSACTLSGSARLSATNDKTGVRGPVPTRATTSDGSQYQRPATIEPGEVATLLLVTGGGCDGGAGLTTYRSITLEVLTRSYPLGSFSLQTACVLEVSDWLLKVPADPPAPPAYAELVPTLQAPATVRAGQRVDFNVTLTNPYDAAVSLAPCPAFRMALYKSGGLYWLNCPAAIPAHGSVRFAMRLQLNGDEVPGPVRLQWQLLDQAGASPMAEAPVTVLP